MGVVKEFGEDQVILQAPEVSLCGGHFFLRGGKLELGLVIPQQVNLEA